MQHKKTEKIKPWANLVKNIENGTLGDSRVCINSKPYKLQIHIYNEIEEIYTE